MQHNYPTKDLDTGFIKNFYKSIEDTNPIKKWSKT